VKEKMMERERHKVKKERHKNAGKKGGGMSKRRELLTKAGNLV
jgi:hypothetical protein